MGFVHGRKTETWLEDIDASIFLDSLDLSTKTDTSESTTFKKTWQTHIVGKSKASVTAHGFYDNDMTETGEFVPTVWLPVTTDKVLTYGPGGMFVVDQLARLVLVQDSDYKETSPVGGIVAFEWTVESNKVVGIGNVLAPITVNAVGVFTGTGSGLGDSLATTTGLVAHLHVQAMTPGDTHTAKLQDATTIGGAYSDIAGGAFVNITAVGAQRLVVPGNIRQFVKIVFTSVGHAATFAAAAART